MSINKVILVGFVGKDPEVRQVGESKVANFSLATSESYKDKQGEWQSRTEWHNIVVWGKRAETVEKHVTKGTQLYIEGKNKTRKWQDKDRNDRYTTEVVIEMYGGEIKFIGKKQDSSQSNEVKQNDNTTTPPIEDDLPF